MEKNGQQHTKVTLLPGKSPCFYWIRAWVGPRAGMDALKEKSLMAVSGIELRFFGDIEMDRKEIVFCYIVDLETSSLFLLAR